MPILKFDHVAVVLVTLLIYLCQTADSGSFPPSAGRHRWGWNHPRPNPNRDYKLSQTYENVISLAFRCISDGSTAKPETAFYSDARFTFKQANGTTSGTFRDVFGSQNYSVGTWTVKNQTGIQLSVVNLQTFWNSLRCDIVNVTTNSKSEQLRVTVTESTKRVALRCPEIDSVLTIDKATYNSIQKPSCFADVRKVVETVCNQTTTSACSFLISNELLKVDPCFGDQKQLNIDYSCARSNCRTGIDGVNENCSQVWTESISNERTLPIRSPEPSGTSDFQAQLTKHEERIGELEKRRDRVQKLIGSLREIIGEQHDLIQDFVVPLLLQASNDTVSAKNQESLNRLTMRLVERVNMSNSTYNDFKQLIRDSPAHIE